METRYREPVTIPDGQYTGKQSGYVLSWMHEGREVDVHLSVGVRGIRVPMRFLVKDNKVVESSVEQIGRETSEKVDTLTRKVFVCDQTTKWQWHANPHVMTHKDAVHVASTYQRRCDDLGMEYAVAIIAAYGNEVYATAATDGRDAQTALKQLPERRSVR